VLCTALVRTLQMLIHRLGRLLDCRSFGQSRLDPPPIVETFESCIHYPTFVIINSYTALRDDGFQNVEAHSR
jgi:hypothetical protein